MHKLKYLLLLLIVPNIGKSQVVNIEVQVIQAFSAQAKLYVYIRNQAELVDSSWQFEPGKYRFKLDENHSTGLYRVDVGKNISFDVIVNNEPEIDVLTTVFAPNDSLKSTKSMENQTLWDYQRLKKRIEQHSWLIRSLKDYYPDTSSMGQTLEIELLRLNQQLHNHAQNILTNNPKLLASKLILLDQKPVAPTHLTGDERRKYQLDNWWHDFQFTDSLLMHSPAFSSNLWGYIELLFYDGYDKEEQDNEFIQGISALMAQPMDLTVTEFVRGILIEGFKDSDYHAVVEYLESTSFHGIKPIKEPVSKKDKNKPKVEVGQIAYDFSVIQPNGKTTKLSKIPAKYKLIVFWSSWCPHCIETLPRIADVYSKYKEQGLEIIAISIDDEDNLWQNYINELNLSWINIREPYSKESKIITQYDVEETPKMFLLSNDLTILSRPSTRRQLEVKIKRLMRGEK